MKARQQRELAETIIGKIEKELENPKVLDQILKQAVSDVESKYQSLHPFHVRTNSFLRDCCAEVITAIT